MKFTINIDCTPEEARTFFGLPDIQPLQQALMKEMEERMLSSMRAASPDALMQQWMPMQAEAYKQMQNMFWGTKSDK